MYPVSLLLLTLFLAVLGILVGRVTKPFISLLLRSKDTQTGKEETYTLDKDPYQEIQPLPDFDWKVESPIRNAPLKPKYHLTMALEQITFSELIVMDNTYLDRMQIRREVMSENHEATIQCNAVCETAVLELYTWIFGTYLPKRFPTIYHLTVDASGLFNTANNETVPLKPTTARDALWTLGAHVDNDFLLLLPSSTAEDGSPIYHLEAFVTCFPTGFSTRQKLGLPLAQIHNPVPGYKAKLEKSMDRFFAKMESGKIVRRGNWAFTTNSELFAESGNHLYADGTMQSDVRDSTGVSDEGSHEETGDIEAEIEKQKREVVIENCRLRSERQTLFRLPQSKALVFSIRTYQYTLEQVKKDGYAEQLAEAMEGLKKGNVPEMDFYKRGVVWREPVVEYLRS